MKKKTIYIFIISLVAVILICFGVFYMIKDSKISNDDSKINKTQEKSENYVTKSTQYKCENKIVDNEKSIIISYLYSFDYEINNETNERNIINGHMIDKYDFQSLENFNSANRSYVESISMPNKKIDENNYIISFEYDTTLLLNTIELDDIDNYINKLGEKNFKCMASN